MTNEQKYKTPDERNHAFNKWCFSSDCESCKLRAHNSAGGAGCRFYWLALEAEEERKPVRNCDKYMTAEEAHQALKEFCGKNECRICRFGDSTRTAGCVLEWLYEEAGKEAE